MRVTRVQWPVGQGNFASGAIETDGGTIHYVYDCGARNVANLEPVVAAYARRVPKVDALFLSHLDGDHVDGLDTLLARVDAKTVYLPYLSASERLLSLAAAEADDHRLTGSFVQAQFDPAAWFGSRGVERIVFVRNRGDRDLLDPPERPEPKETRREGGDAVGVNLEELGQIDVVSDRGAGRSALLQMEIDRHLQISVGGASIDWILRPYVPKVDDKRLAHFKTLIMRALSLGGGSDEIDSGALNSLLKTPHGRAKLRKCYDAILKDGSGAKHNAVSMSLYSGPASDAGRWQVETKSDHGGDTSSRETNSPGWLGTGDAKLKSSRHRNPWQSYYAAELLKTMTLLLPHHGSKANFHEDLLRWPLTICVASSDEREEGYRHPSVEVVEAVENRDLFMAHVTKRLGSRFRETITPVLAPVATTR